MKNIKWKFPLICVVACSILIVILTACDDGYHASVRDIWLSTVSEPEQKTENDDGYTYVDGDGKEVVVRLEYPRITDELQISTSALSPTPIYVWGDIPSSIRTVTLKLTYVLAKIDILTGYEDDPNFEDYYDSDKTTYKTIILDVLDVNLPLISLTMKANEPLTDEPITVTVQPGGVTDTCEVTVQ